MNVFNEAKYAYRERKAEIMAARQSRNEPARMPPPRRAYTIDDRFSVASSHRTRRHGDSSKKRSSGRRHSTSPSRRRPPRSIAAREHDRGNEPQSAPPFHQPFQDALPSPISPFSPAAGPATLDLALPRRSSLPVIPKRSNSTTGIDMDLAYGEPPPNLFERQEQTELKGLVGRVEGLLDEAKCLHHTVTQTMASLQKNPDAMAAVALTLAEISSLLKKMSPGALVSLRRMAPAVFSLLASPQFLIAAGVGVGITVVAFGGYKIVKKIQAKREAENPDQLLAIGADVSRIDTWRRGVAESEVMSPGTSVEGEFITPTAFQMSRLHLNETPPPGPRPRMARASTIATSSARSIKSGSSSRSKSHRSKSAKDVSQSKDGSSSRDASKSKDKQKGKQGESKSKPKPSPLRLMFKS